MVQIQLELSCLAIARWELTVHLPATVAESNASPGFLNMKDACQRKSERMAFHGEFFVDPRARAKNECHANKRASIGWREQSTDSFGSVCLQHEDLRGGSGSAIRFRDLRHLAPKVGKNNVFSTY
jgi:hypothetical protein